MAQYFTVDTLKHPDMEDWRDSMSIFDKDKKLRSPDAPSSSYILLFYEMQSAFIPWRYDTALSEAQNTALLSDYLKSRFFEPIKKVEKCSEIQNTVEGADQNFTMLLFQMPVDSDDPDAREGKSYSYFVMNELAKREQMLRQTLEVRKRERDIKRKLHAAQLRYSVDIEYVDKDGQRTLRTIIPAVVLDRYVEAYCFRRQQRRKFLISRIEKIELGPASSFVDASSFLAEGFTDVLTKIINEHAERLGQ